MRGTRLMVALKVAVQLVVDALMRSKKIDQLLTPSTPLHIPPMVDNNHKYLRKAFSPATPL